MTLYYISNADQTAIQPLSCDEKFIIETTIKGSFVDYRTGITKVDKAIANVATAAACYAASNDSGTLADGAAKCTTARIEVMALTNADSDIVVIPVLFSSKGGPGRKLDPITLTKTSTTDGTGAGVLYCAYASVPIDVGACDQAHFFVSNIGTATSVTLKVRQD